MQIKNNVKIHNRFDIEIIDKNTGELKQSLVSYNIVLNQMYTRLCGGLSYFVNIHFGSGNGTLSPSRTTLFTHLGTKAAVDEEIIKAIPLSVWKRKIVINPEEYVGNTISEVGIAFGSTNTNLVTHSLLKDSEGNSISIIKTDVDVITIYATVFVTFDESNPNLKYMSMPSSNTLVNYLIGGGTAPTGVFSVNDIYIGKTKLGSTATVTWTSDVPNKKRKTNVPRFATTVGNGHIRYLEFANVFSLKLPSSPIFSGQSYSGVSLGVGDGIKTLFNLPSANLRGSSLVIKKNGVVVSSGDYVVSTYYDSFRTYIDRVASYGTLTFNKGMALSEDGMVVAYILDSSPNITICDFTEMGFVVRGVITIPNGVCNEVTLSADGSVLAVSTSANPCVFVYDWNGTSWVVRPNLPNSSGMTSSKGNRISYDGLVLAVNCVGVNPLFFVYDWNGTSWVKRIDVANSYANYEKINISKNKNVFSCTLGVAPRVVVYEWNGSSWIVRATTYSNGTPAINTETALSENGLVLMIVGAYNTNDYYDVYDWNGTSWVARVRPTSIQDPDSCDMTLDGLEIFYTGNGATGVIRHMVWNGTSWSVGTLVATVPANDSGKIRVSKNKRIAVFLDTTGLYTFIANLFTRITFNTPPTISDVITADYTVDGVHKTDQYVIDTSFEILFGEI